MYIRNLINNVKILGVAVATVFTMGACKTYQTTVIEVYNNNKVLAKDVSNGYEIMIDCSKKDKTPQQLSEDLQYFEYGDELTLKNKKPLHKYNYEGRRLFSTADTKLGYNKNTIQIRRDIEEINKIKSKPQTKNRQK